MKGKALSFAVMAAVSVGDGRAVHAANIMAAPQMYQQYAELHNAAFAEKGLDKYVVVNAKGVVLKRAGEATDPVLQQCLLTNADGTLRHEDFLVIQDRIVEVRRRALNGITDLQAAGLSFGVGIGEQLVGFENINEFQAAEQEMNPNAYQNNDTVFTESFVPNPITHQSFQVPWRQEAFDYKRSLGMTESVRQVAERLEDTLTNGNTGIAVNFNGTTYPIYGYTTHPDRGTGTISDWTNAANVELIIPELIDEIGSMWADQGGVNNGRVMVYVANDIWNTFQKDYKAEVRGSIMERAKEIAQVMDVKPLEKLANGTVVLVEMESRTIELAIASDIIAVPHTKTNPFAPQVMTTYAAMVHQIKVDSNGNTGIRHLTS